MAGGCFLVWMNVLKIDWQWDHVVILETEENEFIPNLWTIILGDQIHMIPLSLQPQDIVCQIFMNRPLNCMMAHQTTWADWAPIPCEFFKTGKQGFLLFFFRPRLDLRARQEMRDELSHALLPDFLPDKISALLSQLREHCKNIL